MSLNHVFPFRILVSLLFLTLFLAQHSRGRVISSQIDGETKEKRREMIGSSPPRCEGRCNNCGGHNCEPIQVPIAPQKGTRFLVNSRADNLLSYKPISWKCKCGNSIFNP